MAPAELEHLKRLLAALREQRPSGDAERRALEAFRQRTPAGRSPAEDKQRDG